MAQNSSTPEEIWNLFQSDIERGNREWIFSDVQFEHMIIKDARKLADDISQSTLRKMSEYHQSMKAIAKEPQ